MEIDWKEPDSKELKCILEFGQKICSKNNEATYLIGFIMLLLLELHPLIAFIIKINHGTTADAIKCILFGIFILLFDLGICYLITHYRKKILKDINTNNVKILYVVVRDKKTIEGNSYESGKYTTIQLPDSTLREYKISPEVYDKIGLGSLLIAVKYENGTGFFDEYDLLLNPNTIAEND